MTRTASFMCTSAAAFRASASVYASSRLCRTSASAFSCMLSRPARRAADISFTRTSCFSAQAFSLSVRICWAFAVACARISAALASASRTLAIASLDNSTHLLSVLCIQSIDRVPAGLTVLYGFLTNHSIYCTTPHVFLQELSQIFSLCRRRFTETNPGKVLGGLGTSFKKPPSASSLPCPHGQRGAAASERQYNRKRAL